MKRLSIVLPIAAVWAGVSWAGVELPPEPVNVPELLVTERGERVTDVGLWERVRKPEILKWFRENEYGERPVERPADLSFAEVRPAEPCFGGKAVSKLVRATYSGPGGTESMTFRVWIPKADRPAAVFIHSSPRPAETAADPAGPRPVYLLPAELIVSRGFACIAYCNREIAIDAHEPSADITTSGVFRVFGPAKMENRRPTEWGILSAWAWGASRIMDWIETEPLLDASRVAIVGLSRNGKAALVAGATDERFALTVACCSGCSGAKLNHVYTPGSEMVEEITQHFPYWFCPNYGQWVGREWKDMPYDQHEWIALIAPRLLYISSAIEDVTAGPRGEFASALFASPVWGLYGVGGLGGHEFPDTDAPMQAGNIGYHVRTGHHGITDYDWERYMDFAEGKGWLNGRACPRETAVPKSPEPGCAILDAKWTADWTRNWTVSNLNDIVTLSAKDGVLRLENAGAPKEKGASFLTIRSDLVPVKPGQDFAVLMESRGNLDMLMPVTTFRAQQNQIRAFVPATAVLWFKQDKTPLMAVDASGAILPTGSSFGFADMADEFTLTRHFGTVPKDAAFAALQIGGKYPSFKPGRWLELRRLALKVRMGTDWNFGDIRPPALARVSPSPDPNRDAPFVFTVTDESPIAQLVVKLDGEDVSDKLKAEGEGARKTFSVPHAPWADESLHLLEVTAKDAAGNVAREMLAQYCGPQRKGEKLTVRDDGMILIGGKPFFPIGTAGVRLAPPNGNDPERLFSEFAANGLNCVQGSYAYRTPEECYYDGGGGHQGPRPIAEMEAYYDAARRHGILIRVEPASRDYGTEKRTMEFVEALKYCRDKPEMVFYEIADDTASHVTPDVLKNDYNICRAIDNLALVTQSDANDYAGRYAPYAPATDVFLQEIYPFRNAEHEPNGLSQVIRDTDFAFDGLKVAGVKNRSIWSIPQAFAGWGLWKKYPSRELVRVQTYLAIICGCRGISYYTYWSYSRGADGWGHDSKHTEDLYSVTRELASIVDDLTSRDAKVQPKAEIVSGTATDPGGYPSVSCLLKEGADGKGPLLLAANSHVYGNPVTVRIPLAADKIETVFENGRAVDFKDGVLTDVFAPGEVHIYRLGIPRQ